MNCIESIPLASVTVAEIVGAAVFMIAPSLGAMLEMVGGTLSTEPVVALTASTNP